jgi:hypothetical protein
MCGLVRQRVPIQEAGKTTFVSSEWGTFSLPGDTDQLTAEHEQEQAIFAVKTTLTNLANGARFTIWYDWKDDGNEPNNQQHHYGLVRRDGSLKPAYFALKTLNTQLNGYSYVCSVETAARVTLLFNKGAAYRAVSWSNESGRNHVSRTILKDAVGMVGRRLSQGAAVNPGNEPVYSTWFGRPNCR